ncbi:hypothetical protein DH2020_029498 [Rehmannia glutinosa]|uniref:PPPDE domain-containing protein n=1 Tax=Rehmannia glutinosa TaxID=99300 RepID=A0ABR0VR31_REHGL
MERGGKIPALNADGAKEDFELELVTKPFLVSPSSMKSKSKNGWRSIVPLHMRGESATRFCVFPKVKSANYSSGDTPVYLNVYDLTPVNGYFYWAGVGVFHSGVEAECVRNFLFAVHGIEYAFGAHEYPTSGIFEIEPRECPGFRFRKSIFMGTTRLNHNQVREFMEHQATNYYGDTYHLVVKNCNHFCEDVCYKLTGNRIPKWVNRLARIGFYPFLTPHSSFPLLLSFSFERYCIVNSWFICSLPGETKGCRGPSREARSFCNCILPEALKTTTVHHNANYQDTDSEKKNLRSSLSCFSSISMHRKKKKYRFHHYSYTPTIKDACPLGS